MDALADSTRRRIIEMLAAGEMSAGDIAKQFEVSAPAISQHLKVLQVAKLVRVRVQAQSRIYDLDQSGLDEIASWLNNVRHFWAGRLDVLETKLKRADNEEKHS